MNENGPVVDAEQDDRAKPARLSRALPGDPLLDDTSTKVGVYKPARGVSYRVAQNGIRIRAFRANLANGLVLNTRIHLRL